MRRLLPVLAALGALLALSGCRVTVDVSLDVRDDGGGTITLVATADADVVRAAGGLADDLDLTDAIAAGWEVTGPASTADGGLRLTVRHGFDTTAEATALLASINGPAGPLRSITVAQTVLDTATRFTVTGALGIDGGLDAFADADLLATIGATPYAPQIAAAGLTPAEALAVRLSLDLPGSPDADASGAASTLASDGTATWAVPLDGTAIEVAASTTLSSSSGGGWRWLATAAIVVGIAWVVLIGLLFVAVARARARRAARRAAGRRRPPRVAPRA